MTIIVELDRGPNILYPLYSVCRPLYLIGWLVTIDELLTNKNLIPIKTVLMHGMQSYGR